MVRRINKIARSIKGVLFADPDLLYKEEIALTNKPFHFSGSNGKAVLLLHGWSSTPYEVRRLGKYLNENNYTVSAPMLRGHGTVPKDLENVHWTDWLSDVQTEYARLKKTHAKVFVGGTSIGASLSVMLAERNSDISGLVLMAMPYRMKLERAAVMAAKVLGRFKKYNKKFYPPTFGLSTTITRLISYQTYPIQSALLVFELVKKARTILPTVTQPCFILQSRSDHIVAKGSLERIYEKIGSRVKSKRYLEKAYHTFISDIKNEHVFEDILKFIAEN